jgi:hypothetical protein
MHIHDMTVIIVEKPLHIEHYEVHPMPSHEEGMNHIEHTLSSEIEYREDEFGFEMHVLCKCLHNEVFVVLQFMSRRLYWSML